MTHIVMPYLFVAVFTLWGHFVLSKPLWENINEALGIVGIYYMLVSIFWVTQMKAVQKVEQEINSKKGDK